MRRLTDSTRTKIIDAGEKLLLKNGFNGFSYADIALALGIKKSSIHYHFPSKADLGLAVIQRPGNVLADGASVGRQQRWPTG